ncbi:hypothetical protein NLU13_2383 [Sarocladium strictum]|uniref:Rhodopsin domain-containing protein n=1 Tax=Sarocladium strictum TaxID=5046 RepID=A0AA39GUP1_SARSR|nr:hypothetical protein NLU13_2383 [Sarocladium strictum]
MASQPDLLPHQTPEYMKESRAGIVMGVIISVTAVSTLFVIARTYCRRIMVGQMWLDDWLVIVSAISQWICVGLATHAAQNGQGRHFDAMLVLAPEKLERALLFTMLNFPFGILSFALPKVAVVALLVRILSPGRAHRCFLWGLSITCMIMLLISPLLLFLQCRPVHSAWTLDYPQDQVKCWDPSILFNFSAVAGSLSAFTDLYLAVYPAFVLWKLQMKRRKKLALSIALGIGSISTVVAIYKCTRLKQTLEPDFTWETADLVIWTVVEASVIIIACCIPILQPLVDVCYGRRSLTGKRPSSRGYNHYGSSRDGTKIELAKYKTRQPAKRSSDVSRSAADDIDDDTDHVRSLSNGAESQESILHGLDGRAVDGKPRHIHTARAVEVRGGERLPEEDTGKLEQYGGLAILRTDAVSVSYVTDNKRTQKGLENWGAIGGI